jgi:outer membrane protein TolC
MENQMKRLALLALGLSSLAACVTYEQKTLVATEAAAGLTARTLDDTGLRSFIGSSSRQFPAEWPLATWNLDQLTLAAFYFHPDLAVARAQWATATAAEITAGERPNPAVSLGPAYNTTSSIVSPWIVTANIDAPFETGGKRNFRIEQAMQLSEAARLHVASVAWAVRGRVAASLIDLYTAHDAEAVLREQQTLYAETTRLLEAQFEAGAISAFELSQARLQAYNARLALLDAERRTAEAGVRMASALGLPASALQDVRFSFDSLRQLPQDLPVIESRYRALSNRADILGALAEYAASQYALQREISKQYPDINLGPGYEYDQGDNKWSLGFSMTLPVFNRNQGAIAEALALRDEAAERFNALQSQVLAEIDMASAGYRAALRTQKNNESMFAELQYEEQSAQAMFDAGEISPSELAGLQIQLSAMALARVDVLANAHKAAAQLEQALQFPLGIPESTWQSAPRNSATGSEKGRP